MSILVTRIKIAYVKCKECFSASVEMWGKASFGFRLTIELVIAFAITIGAWRFAVSPMLNSAVKHSMAYFIQWPEEEVNGMQPGKQILSTIENSTKHAVLELRRSSVSSELDENTFDAIARQLAKDLSAIEKASDPKKWSKLSFHERFERAVWLRARLARVTNLAVLNVSKSTKLDAGEMEHQK